jgi:hypothetical protein
MKMSRLLITALTLTLCVTAHGVPAKKAAPRAAGRPEFVNRRTPGAAFVIIDARTSATQDLAPLVANLERFCRITCTVERKPDAKAADGYALARACLDKQQGNGAVAVIVDGPADGPALTVFPENRAGVINATRYAAGTDASTAAKRIEKELWRVLAFVAGGVETEEHCVLKPVLKPEDLDGLVASTLSPNVAMRVAANATRFGFSQVEHVPYRMAVMRGWAPAPTNAAQKAIWDQVHKSKAKATDGDK